MKAESLGHEAVSKWFTAYLPEKDFGRYLDFVDRQFRYLKINLIEFNWALLKIPLTNILLKIYILTSQ